MANLTITITGDVQWKLARLSQLLQPPSMAAFMGESISIYLHERARQRFENEGDDASGKWKQLTEATQRIRESQGFPAAHPINVRTGELKAYIEDTPSAIVPDPQGVTLTMPGKKPGNSKLAEKVRVAQQGDPSVRTPARPVLGLSERDALGILSELEIYVRTGLATGGL